MAASIFYVDSLGGGGVRKMPILLNKISTKGGRGVKKVQNLVYVEYGCRLITNYKILKTPFFRKSNTTSKYIFWIKLPVFLNP